MKIKEVRASFINSVNEEKLEDSSKKTYQRKLDVFLTFLIANYDINMDSNINIIKPYVITNVVVESTKFYINKSKIKYSATIECYISVLKSFFKYLDNNLSFDSVFDSDIEKNNLDREINKLSKEHNLETTSEFYPITYATYKELINKCNTNIQNYIIDDQLISRTVDPSKKKDGYGDFISSIATKIVLLTGVSNSAIYALEISDIDFANNNIKINGFSIYLPHRLRMDLEKYVIVREKILKSTNNIEESTLFINRVGKSAKNDNNLVFSVVGDVLGNMQVKTLCKYTIIELIKSNASILQIMKLAECGYGTIEHCVEITPELADTTNLELKIRSLKNFTII